MSYYRVVFAFVSGLLLTIGLGSCSSSKKLTAPAVTLSTPDALPALPSSEIDLPIKIAGRPLLAAADSIVPKEFVSEGWPAFLQPSCDFRYRYRFVRSAFTIQCSNNRIAVQMQGKYQVAGGKCLCAAGRPVSPWISGYCGFDKEPLRRVDLSFSTQLRFMPDYRIITASAADPVKALDRCTMSLFSMDMTQLITDSIRASVMSFCKTFDATIAGMNFSGYAHKTAARAWQKTPIGSYGYLVVNPVSVRVGTLNYVKDTFSISMGITCRPELSSDSLNPSRLPPLPPLLNGANRSGVILYLPASYEYSFLNKLINDTIRNKSFVFKGRTVIIREVALKGTGRHQVEIRIDFDGDHKGRVYLRGTPVLDTARQTLSVPDITYSLESKDLAIKMARALFRNKIRKSVKGNSYLDLAAMLKTNLPALDAQLNRGIAPNLRSSGEIRQLKLIGLLAGDKGIQAQLLVKADLSILSTGLPR